MDISEALADPQTSAVLEVWWFARLHEAPAFAGGVLTDWPAVMVEGLAICRVEETAVDDFLRWKGVADG